MTFPAQPRDHEAKVNRKMFQGALRCILAELIRQERLRVIEHLVLEAPKTAQLVRELAAMGLGDVLIVVADEDRNLALAARNVPSIEVCTSAAVNPVNLLGHEQVLMSEGALQGLERRLA